MNQNDGRIIDLPLAETASDDDYLMLDGIANGTRKIRKDKVGTTGISLTQSEYDALTEEQKMNGTVYYVTDAESNEETELWSRVGRQTLATESQVISGAINELKALIDELRNNS